jgi:hypothetical protein
MMKMLCGGDADTARYVPVSGVLPYSQGGSESQTPVILTDRCRRSTPPGACGFPVS